MEFKENFKYLLEQSIFNRSILTCHCVQDGWAYLSSDTPSSQIYTEKVEYKYNIKKQRMYVFNKVFQSWDNVQEYTVTEYGNAETSSASYKTYTVI
jgi:hypothetical protein